MNTSFLGLGLKLTPVLAQAGGLVEGASKAMGIVMLIGFIFGTIAVIGGGFAIRSSVTAAAERRSAGMKERRALQRAPSLNMLEPMDTITASQKRQHLGQFLTPEATATFMASLFEKIPQRVKLLDAGAGAGVLSEALVRKLCSATLKPQQILVSAYELDSEMIPLLEHAYARCEAECLRAGIEFRAEVANIDFIEAVLPLVRGDLFSSQKTPFNAAILNPPYRKIQGNSGERLLLRSAGIETSNLYTGFLALAARLLANDGELVAITPRSFCNGPYFKVFRQQFLSQMSLRRLHLLDSRSMAFREDAVLQENIIIHAVKSAAKPQSVTVSISPGVPDENSVCHRRFYVDIISPDDPEQFIHFVADDAQEGQALRATVLNLTRGAVSTRRVGRATLGVRNCQMLETSI